MWSAVIAPPGSSKTPALNAMLAPLHNVERQYTAAYGRDMSRYKQLLRAHKTDPDKNPEPAEPIEHKLLANDFTIEGLADALKDNPRGMLVSCDELSGLIGSFDAYKNGAKKDRPAMLESWNGQPRVIDRVERGRTVV